MKTRMFLVRHGATTLTADDRFAGSTDVPLGDDGHIQVERLSVRLAAAPIAAAYSSPMRRTMASAAAIARPHGLTPVAVDALREIDHGHWEGLRRADVQRDFPDEYAAWEHDPLMSRRMEGRRGTRCSRERGRRSTRYRRHAGESVLVVSHKATNRLLIASLLGMDLRHYRDRFDQLPACLNLLDFTGPGNVRLVLLNDVSHYEMVEVSV